jgi:L-cysteine S-thiosulfotransferase
MRGSTTFVPLTLLLMLSLPIAAQNNIISIEGRNIFTDVKKGNCIACHQVPNDTTFTSQSNIGPALQSIRSRFPNSEKLREIISDQSKIKPSTIMPPYGRNRILTDAEIDAVVRYLELV